MYLEPIFLLKWPLSDENSAILQLRHSQIWTDRTLFWLHVEHVFDLTANGHRVATS